MKGGGIFCVRETKPLFDFPSAPLDKGRKFLKGGSYPVFALFAPFTKQPGLG